MGTAASSALRDDSPDSGLAYGSLTGLGGPKTFKKKPVLVLDPEELERAHAAFHEASAELLGEQPERAPRPATILGLAPMLDDDPEEMGESDDAENAGEDDGMPSAEAVLSLTRSKHARPADEDYFGEGYEGEEMFAPLPAEEPLQEAANHPSPQIEDGLDIANRIFPSLPVQQELDAGEDADGPPDVGYDMTEYEHVAEPEPEPDAAFESEPVEDNVPHEVPQPEPAPEPEPQTQIVSRSKPEAGDGPRPARFDELNPARSNDGFDLDSWLAEPAQPQVPAPPTARSEPEPLPETPASAPVENLQPQPVEELRISTYDEPEVDGYAFMRDPRSRRTGVHSATPGPNNSLRARLLREAEEEAAQAARRKAEGSAPAPQKPRSVTMRLVQKLRGLFS